MTMTQSLTQNLNQKQLQTLRMSPQLQQAIRMLELTHLELLEMIEAEMEQNPALEFDNEDDTADSSENSGESTEEITDSYGELDGITVAEPKIEDSEVLDREGSAVDLDEYFEDRGAPVPDDTVIRAEEQNSYENYVPYKPSLIDHLMEQLSIAINDPDDREIGEFLIGNISDAGLLRISIEEAAECLNADVDDVQYVANIIKTFSPAGIGAENLSECLLIQFKYLKYDDEIAEKIISDYLEDLGRNRIQNIAREMNITVDDVNDALELIRTLNPKPGLEYAGSEETQYIRPDVFVEQIDDRYVVTLNRDFPRVRVASDYRKAYEAQKQKKVSRKKRDEMYNFIRQKVKAAEFFKESIIKGQETIRNISQAIVDYQTDFFDKGVEYLRPMRCQDIADQVGVHEATVCRVSRGKYMHTPRGVFELKYFFSGGVQDDSHGEDASSKAVMEKIRKIVEAEDPKKPLSDQKISNKLKEEGIVIARRTVAKYREAMGILATSLRRKY